MRPLGILGPGAFRLILAGFVVISHLSKWNVGEPAVFVFFTLSGYWVSRMYLRKYSRHDHPIRNFYLSRFLRVWPTYAAAVTLSILMIGWLSGEVRHELWAGLLLFGVASHGLDALNVSWALDIELQFYLLLPFFVLLCRREHAGWLFMGSVVAAIAGWSLYAATGVKILLCYLPMFFAGVLIAVRDISFTPRITAWMTLLFLVVIGIFFANDVLRAFFTKTVQSPFNEEWMTMALMLLLLPFIAHNVRQKSGWLDAHLGNLSYSVYLVHFPLIAIVTKLLGRGMELEEKPIFLLVLMVVSVFFYIAFDRHFEAFRRRVMRRRLTKTEPGKEMV